MTTIGQDVARTAEGAARSAEGAADGVQVPLSRHMGLGQFVHAIVSESQADHLGVHAGNMAYRTLFAVFPALVSLFWLLKLLGQTRATSGLIDLASNALPKAASGAVKQELMSVTGAPAGGTLSLTAIALAVLAVATIAEACNAAMSALNAVYGVEESRSFVRRESIAVALSLAVSALLVGALLVLVLGSAIGNKLAGVAGLGGPLHWLWLIGSWPLLLLVVTAAFALLYYFGPDVEQRFRWVSPGIAAGVCLWLVFAGVFSLYINNFASPGQTYGALAGVAVLMVYVLGSAMALLVGAEVNQVLEARQPDGKQRGERAPEGEPAETADGTLPR